MNFPVFVNKYESVGDLRDDGPNFVRSGRRYSGMDKNCRSNTSGVLIKVEGTQLHVDIGVG